MHKKKIVALRTINRITRNKQYISVLNESLMGYVVTNHICVFQHHGRHRLEFQELNPDTQTHTLMYDPHTQP